MSRDTHFPALRGHLLSRRALELVAASGAGRDPLLDLLHPETAAIDLDDVAVVQQTVEDCGRQDLVSTFALSGLDRSCLGSAARPVRPSGRVGRRCVPVKGVGFLQLGRLEWT